LFVIGYLGSITQLNQKTSEVAYFTGKIFTAVSTCQGVILTATTDNIGAISRTMCLENFSVLWPPYQMTKYTKSAPSLGQCV